MAWRWIKLDVAEQHFFNLVEGTVFEYPRTCPESAVGPEMGILCSTDFQL
jgi:hypothetical protein